MALLVASLLMAALARVITRKMHSEQIDISAKRDLNEKKVCGYVNDTFEDIKSEDCTAPSDAHFGSAIIVSGEGGGNYKESFISSSSSCSGLTGKDTTNKSNWATYDSTNKLCVTKYNQVSNSDYATHEVTSYDDNKCSSKYTHTCETTQKSMAYPYSGCNRPICTYAKAVAACSRLSGYTNAD